MKAEKILTAKELAEEILPILEDSFLALFAAKNVLWNSRGIYYLNTSNDYRKLTLNKVIEALAKYPQLKKIIDSALVEEQK